MAASKPLVVIGMLGPTLDSAPTGPARWERWRPTVALCQHEDLEVARLELIYQKRFIRLADAIVEDIARVSPTTEVRRHIVEIENPWDFEEVYGALHDYARAYPFKPDAEDYLVHITTGTHVAQICMFLLAESRHIPGRLLQLSPQKREETPGPGSFAIIDLDLSKYDRLASRFKAERREGASFLKSGIDTRNAGFNRLIDRIEQVAVSSRAPLLLTGPTGAGKSKLAKKIFELKKQRRQVAGELVEVNCATLHGDTASSTLFGHVKGAFTGAIADRPGLLRKADGGVLFLDEIGELGLDEQAMLLRALEEKVFFPVGSDREIRSDFQLLAGTNRDLAAAVAEGRFREDLFARINLWTFRLPALHERPEDVEPNLEFELEQLARTTGVNVTFNREARERFLVFSTSPDARWTGNFRDFNAAIVRMATLAAGARITRDVVEEEIGRLRDAWRRPSAVTTGEGGDGHADLERALGPKGAAELDPFDRVQLAEVLRVCRQARSLSAAGRVLFASSRAKKKSSNDADRLSKYLARFGIDWKALSA
jgi:transcriptional regulatory protein RtcR